MSTATETIETFANKEYEFGFVSDIDSETIPVGLSEDVVRLISKKERRAGVAAGISAQSLSALADDGRPDVAQRQVSSGELSRRSPITPPRSPRKVLASLDEVDPDLAVDVRQAGHLAGRTEAVDQRRRGRRLRQRLRRHDVQGQAGRDGRDFLLVLRSREDRARVSASVLWARSFPTRTTITRR